MKFYLWSLGCLGILFALESSAKVSVGWSVTWVAVAATWLLLGIGSAAVTLVRGRLAGFGLAAPPRPRASAGGGPQSAAAPAKE